MNDPDFVYVRKRSACLVPIAVKDPAGVAATKG